jgi:hypothetical protein
MSLECPHGCGARFPMSVTTCPGCGKSTAATDFLLVPIRKTWNRLWGGEGHALKAECPHCHGPFSLDEVSCPHCGGAVDTGTLVAEFTTPLVRLMLAIRQRAEQITPFEAWVIRLSHLLVSLSLVGMLSGMAEDRFIKGNGNWFSAAFATAIYLGMSLLILTWIVPRNLLPAFARLKVLTKLSFFLNYLATVFAIMFLSDHWRMRSWLLIGTFASTIVGIWLCSTIILPSWAKAGGILSGNLTGNSSTPPSDPNQRGRRTVHRPNRFS